MVMRKILLASCVCAVCCARSYAFYPPQCLAAHAELDDADSDAVVIARVVKVEQVVETIGEWRDGRPRIAFDYFATLKVGRVIRGELKMEQTFRMYEGGYEDTTENNSEPSY